VSEEGFGGEDGENHICGFTRSLVLRLRRCFDLDVAANMRHEP